MIECYIKQHTVLSGVLTHKLCFGIFDFEKLKFQPFTIHEEPTCQAWLDHVKAEKCVDMKDTDYDVIRLLNRTYEEMKPQDKNQQNDSD